MGDQNTGEEENLEDTETGADDQDESSNDGGADDEAEGADKSDDENADEEESEDGDEADEKESGKDKADKTAKDKDGKTDKSKPTPKADEEPATRKRNVDFILERQNRKAEKAKNKEKNAAADEEGEEDEEIADDDAKIIDKRVQAHLKPFIEKQMQDEDKAEIAKFVKDNPDFAPYAAKAEKFAQHASRKNIPIKAIFYEVAGDDLMKIGAKRAKEADKEAAKTKAGGGNAKGGESEKGVWEMSDEEFAARQQSVRTKPRE